MNQDEAYIQKIQELTAKAASTQLEAVRRTAEEICRAYQADRWLYLFGTGHSHILAEELFYRAGGLVRVKPILEGALMLHESASRSTQMERLSGYARILLEDYDVRQGDVLLIISNSGRNSVSIEMAMEAKKRGACVAALTSLEHSKSASSRHPSGKRLFELADIVLDNGGCCGDACIAFGERKAAPTSTVIDALLLNAVVCAVIERMEERGILCETFSSSNLDGGEAVNQQYLDRYRGQIRSL